MHIMPYKCKYEYMAADGAESNIILWFITDIIMRRKSMLLIDWSIIRWRRSGISADPITSICSGVLLYNCITNPQQIEVMEFGF